MCILFTMGVYFGDYTFRAYLRHRHTEAGLLARLTRGPLATAPAVRPAAGGAFTHARQRQLARSFADSTPPVHGAEDADSGYAECRAEIEEGRIHAAENVAGGEHGSGFTEG